ncbi:hypothetical protein Kpol_185p1 [Vanderwaltozyma polyspora DSM 70294]|uniref:M-phase inducer phosphatase n=1 Tax=Vanderwaltozyma polyspora (strain ATCC 22028 / DSM 70294 / BCRC 21397 / CBS 2163 / NBRC 10782 / NRRL Y-8283 / UCD 57-17) TaxID=436907 RepID=A7TTK7_VANPO|nr:uncharacterized protein Kpol_185p1 [Vanderwaltozyma polyspora DSM 70294]EDO14398.1 hypothetical protein Kpol_185p1 [Vanderwaltozyma polyspora DSM 70294]
MMMMSKDNCITTTVVTTTSTADDAGDSDEVSAVYITDCKLENPFIETGDIITSRKRSTGKGIFNRYSNDSNDSNNNKYSSSSSSNSSSSRSKKSVKHLEFKSSHHHQLHPCKRVKTDRNNSSVINKIMGQNCYHSLLSISGLKINSLNINDVFPRVTSDTLSKILNDNIHSPHYDNYFIIDSRFHYEYSGGHIRNSININTTQDIHNLLITKGQFRLPTLIIFYCEYSKYRSPKLASHLRKCDRYYNKNNYPKLFYPDIVLLEGGYNTFYKEYPQLCYPNGYIPMNSPKNRDTCGNSMQSLRDNLKKEFVA